MDNGIYIALSRQVALFKDMETTANNIANANTTGFQSSHLMFSSYLADSGNRDKMAYAHDVSTYRSTQPGALSVTNNPLDVAIKGNGYFMVQTPLGVRYTKAGNFQMDGGNTLVTAEGYPVLDENSQPIILPENAQRITIGSIGNITVDGEEIGTLGLAEFANPQEMKRTGERLLSSDVPPLPPTTSSVAQGTLETANVNPVIELTHMIEVSRAVGGTAKYIEVLYDLQRKTGAAWTSQQS